MKIYWYRHAHENRNNLLRFGLMRLHKAKKIIYIEKDIQKATLSGFSNEIATSDHRHLSFLSINEGNMSKKVIVDNEDSFIHCSAYLKEADEYFTASYNTLLYKNKTFPEGYSWQTEKETSWYRARTEEIIDELGDHFYKVKPFIPITPSLDYAGKRPILKQKRINITNRFFGMFKNHNYWLPVLNDFEKRYLDLQQLRQSNLTYDIVLNDTLWGWPKHRIKLHHKLVQLGTEYDINSILNWHQPNLSDDSINLNLDAEQFPITSGHPITNYEKMLSESKLAVFATGFHWGWRNIMTLALFFGIPVLIDKPILAPYFDLNEFKIFYNDTDEWETIKPLLDQITPANWQAIKKHNQLIYDKFLSPEAVANYFIKTIISE